MIITLKKGNTTMAISSLGAEPQSLVRDGIEYIWQGDPAFWPRKAPLLFPMSGPTKDNKLSCKGRIYDMPNNGFARDNEFKAEQLTDDIAQFTLEDNETFREKYYPYGFVLTVTYTLHEDGYTARAEIYAKEDLHYTFAWHPGFSLDINGKGCDLETYSLSFLEEERLDRLYQSGEGYVREKDFLIGDSLDLKRADAVAKAPKCMGYAVELDAMTAVLRAELSAGAVWRVRDLAVGGADVIRERGVEPGPGVGMVLAQLLEAVKAGEVPNRRDDLLAWLRW